MAVIESSRLALIMCGISMLAALSLLLPYDLTCIVCEWVCVCTSWSVPRDPGVWPHSHPYTKNQQLVTDITYPGRWSVLYFIPVSTINVSLVNVLQSVTRQINQLGWLYVWPVKIQNICRKFSNDTKYGLYWTEMFLVFLSWWGSILSH